MLVAQARKLAPLFLIDSGVPHGISANIALIENRFGPRDARFTLVARRAASRDNAERYASRAVDIVAIEYRVGPVELSLQPSCIGVDQ